MPPLVALDEARDVVVDLDDLESWRASSGRAFAWDLHREAVAHWLRSPERADGPSEYLMAIMIRERPRRPRRQELWTPMIDEFDRLAAVLVALVDEHLRDERPDMASTVRAGMALRAAQVGLCRLALGETYAQIAARPEIHGSLRTVKTAFGLLLDAYVVTWRRALLPATINPVALSRLRSR
ncbi:MAG: hypothetical protein ACR2LK_14010 [Solirubrobacteraceae bacterium]